MLVNKNEHEHYALKQQTWKLEMQYGIKPCPQ